RGLLAAPCPACPQRRKQEQIRFVFKQDDAARPQLREPAAQAPFFSPARDRAPRHTGTASTPTPTVATATAGWSRTAVARGWPRGARSAKARSSGRLGSPSGRGTEPNSRSAPSAAAESTRWVAHPLIGRTTPPDRIGAGSALPSGRDFAGSHLS